VTRKVTNLVSLTTCNHLRSYVQTTFHVKLLYRLTLKILFAEKSSAGSIPAPGTFQRVGLVKK